jgi:phosphonoacetaldehyde hydrolase
MRYPRSGQFLSSVEFNYRPEPGEAEVLSLFEEFGSLQMKIIAQHSQVSPGVAQVVREWQNCGLRIGSTTGYTRQMLAPVLTQAAQQGFQRDASVRPMKLAQDTRLRGC